MKTQTSKQVYLLKSFILLPLLATLIYGFSEKIIIEKSKDLNQTHTQEIQIKEDKGATEAMMEEYNNFMIKYKPGERINNKEISRVIAIYKMMTNTQRNSIKTPPNWFFNIYDNGSRQRHPSKAEFERWKKSTEHIFFIDGKVIRNYELKNYTPEEIYSYSNCFAIDNKNPDNGTYKSIKYMLLTKEGLKKNTLDSNHREYNKLLLTYLNEKEKFLKSDRSNNSELKILKLQLDELLKHFTEQDLKKLNIKKTEKIPEKHYKISKKILLSKEAQEYNSIAKKYNNQYNIYNIREIKNLFTLYESLTLEEKENTELFPYFDHRTIENVKRMK